MKILGYFSTLILPIGLAAFFSQFKLIEGKMCSAMTTAADSGDLTTLRDKAIAAFRAECRVKKTDQPDYINSTGTSCSFFTAASEPHSFMFLSQPLAMPFRLNFTVKTLQAAGIALSVNKTDQGIFAEITIGAFRNQRVMIRPCYYLYTMCSNEVVGLDEIDLLNVNNYRPFWIEYEEGVVMVGKTGQKEALLEWDASTFHQQVPTQVHVGIASWAKESANWVFNQACG